MLCALYQMLKKKIAIFIIFSLNFFKKILLMKFEKSSVENILHKIGIYLAAQAIKNIFLRNKTF
jgi:hypothetical protein